MWRPRRARARWPGERVSLHHTRVTTLEYTTLNGRGQQGRARGFADRYRSDIARGLLMHMGLLFSVGFFTLPRCVECGGSRPTWCVPELPCSLAARGSPAGAVGSHRVGGSGPEAWFISLNKPLFRKSPSPTSVPLALPPAPPPPLCYCTFGRILAAASPSAAVWSIPQISRVLCVCSSFLINYFRQKKGKGLYVR